MRHSSAFYYDVATCMASKINSAHRLPCGTHMRLPYCVPSRVLPTRLLFQKLLYRLVGVKPRSNWLSLPVVSDLSPQLEVCFVHYSFRDTSIGLLVQLPKFKAELSHDYVFCYTAATMLSMQPKELRNRLRLIHLVYLRNGLGNKRCHGRNNRTLIALRSCTCTALGVYCAYEYPRGNLGTYLNLHCTFRRRYRVQGTVGIFCTSWSYLCLPDSVHIYSAVASMELIVTF